MIFLVSLILLSPFAPTGPAMPHPPDRVQLQVDASAAEGVLAILEVLRGGGAAPDSLWARVFASEPYQRLKLREAQMRRDFSDAEFRAFVESDALRAQAPALRRTLEAWQQRDLEAAARRVLAYLPEQARIHARIYPMIKPQTNSFVFDLTGQPAIFLYLDPDQTSEQFENTVAHELHHIGFASFERSAEGQEAAQTEAVREVTRWLGAFGEGFAMLAAAGGIDVHPHAASPPDDRARWDQDVSRFEENLRALDSFFVHILTDALSAEEIRNRAFSFYGIQGPWYTVGYQMAVLMERHRGRPALIDAMIDPRQLIVAYNEIAATLEAQDGHVRARWSAAVIDALYPEGRPDPAP